MSYENLASPPAYSRRSVYNSCWSEPSVYFNSLRGRELGQLTKKKLCEPNLPNQPLVRSKVSFSSLLPPFCFGRTQVWTHGDSPLEEPTVFATDTPAEEEAGSSRPMGHYKPDSGYRISLASCALGVGDHTTTNSESMRQNLCTTKPYPRELGSADPHSRNSTSGKWDEYRTFPMCCIAPLVSSPSKEPQRPPTIHRVGDRASDGISAVWTRPGCAATAEVGCCGWAWSSRW